MVLGGCISEVMTERKTVMKMTCKQKCRPTVPLSQDRIGGKVCVGSQKQMWNTVATLNLTSYHDCSVKKPRAAEQGDLFTLKLLSCQQRRGEWAFLHEWNLWEHSPAFVLILIFSEGFSEYQWAQLSCVKINYLSSSAAMGCEANNYLCSGSCNSEERIFQHKCNSGFLMQWLHETR